MSYTYNDSARYGTNIARRRTPTIELNMFYIITFIVLLFAFITSGLALLLVRHQLPLITTSTILSGVSYFTLVIGMGIEKGDE